VGGRWRVVRVTAKLTPLILAARDSSDEANARPKTMTKPVAQTRAQKSHSKRHCYEVKRAKKKMAKTAANAKEFRRQKTESFLHSSFGLFMACCSFNLV